VEVVTAQERPVLVGGLGRPLKAEIGRPGGRVVIGEDRVGGVGEAGRGQSRTNGGRQWER
jgi:hypothetical protein